MKSNLLSCPLVWGFGLILPIILVIVGVISIFTGDSVLPISQGMGRFSLGASPISGSRATLMGIAYISFASLLFGTCFTPIRSKAIKVALGCQILGFTIFFYLFWYILIFSR